MTSYINLTTCCDPAEGDQLLKRIHQLSEIKKKRDIYGRLGQCDKQPTDHGEVKTIDICPKHSMKKKREW